MPILAVLDEAAHGALEDSLKTLYVQNTENKNFYLDIAPDEAAKVAFTLQTQFENKKTELTRVHNEKKELATKVAAFEALGKSADEIKTALESNRPEEVTKLIEKYEAEKEALKKSFEEPLTTATERAKQLESQIQHSLTQSEIQKLRNEYDLNETADYVLRDFIKVVPKEEGSSEYVVKVFESGQPKQIAGQDVSPEQLIKGFQEARKFPAMFNTGSGSGTGAGQRTAGASGSKQYEGLSAVEKLNLAREQGVKT